MDITAAGIDDKDLIDLTKELMGRVSFRLEYIEQVSTRVEAIEMLALIADVARNNPLLMWVEKNGELPAEIIISAGEPTHEAKEG